MEIKNRKKIVSTNIGRALSFLALLIIINGCAIQTTQKNAAKKGGVSAESKPSIPLPPLAPLSVQFSNPPSIVSVKEVYALTEEQKEHFLKQFNSQSYMSVEPHNRIYKYLETNLSNFNYYADTFTASESLAQNKGNCLSLAILTKSLADLANVDASYQLVETAPVFSRKGNIVLSSQHIRTILYAPIDIAPDPDEILVFRGRIFVDYFPSYNTRVLRTVDELEFKSMYYTNKAAEHLIIGDNKTAYWHLKKALDLKPNHSHAINMMALLYERVGDFNYAERLFKYGIDYSDENLDVLNNYHSLLKQQGRTKEAEKLAIEIGRKNDTNPFKWISLGNSAYNSREYKKAVRYYRRASKIAPYLHESFAGISRSKFQLGAPEQAKKAMNKALENSMDSNLQKLYRAKLDMLTEFLSKGTPVVIGSEQ